MLHRRDSVFIAQMVEAAEAALEFSDGHTAESFAGDPPRRLTPWCAPSSSSASGPRCLRGAAGGHPGSLGAR